MWGHRSLWLLVKGCPSESLMAEFTPLPGPRIRAQPSGSPFGTSGTEMQVLAAGRVARVCQGGLGSGCLLQRCQSHCPDDETEAHRCLLSKLSRLVIAMLGSDSFPGPGLMCQTEIMIPTIIAKMARLSIY